MKSDGLGCHDTSAPSTTLRATEKYSGYGAPIAQKKRVSLAPRRADRLNDVTSDRCRAGARGAFLIRFSGTVV